MSLSPVSLVRSVLGCIAAGLLAGFLGCAPPGPRPLPAKATIRLENLKPPVAVSKGTIKPLDELAAKAVRQAEKLIADAMHHKAIRLLTQAMGDQSDHPAFLRTRGLARLGLKQYEEAHRDLSAAAAVDGDDLRVHLAMGRIAVASKRPQDAILSLRRALACSQAVDAEPMTGQALLLLAAQLQSEDYWTASLQCYERLCVLIDLHGRRYAEAAQLEPYVLRPQLLYVRCGRLLLLLRRPSEAADILDRAFRRDRTSPRAAQLLMAALTRCRRQREARQLLRQLTDEPTQRTQLPAIAAELAEALTRSGQPQEAAEAVADVIVRTRKPQLIDLAVRRIASAAKDDDWIGDFTAAIASGRSPVDYALHYIAGRLLLAGGDHDAAVEQMKLAIDARGDFAPAYESLLEIHLAAGDRRKLDKLTAGIRSTWPDSHFTHYAQGKVDLARGRVHKAIEQLQKARDLDPDHAATLVDLSQAYARAGQTAAATQSLYDALSKNPDDQAIYRRLFDLQLARGEYARARAVARQMLRRDEKNIRAKAMLAEAQLGLGNRDEALELIGQLKRQAGSDVEVQMLDLTAELDLPAGLPAKATFDEAIRRLEAMAERHGGQNRPLQMKAQLLLRVGRCDEAAAILGRIHAQDPIDSRAAKAYAAALIEAEKHQEALDVVEGILASGSEEDWPRRTSLDLLSRLGRIAEALDRCDRYIVAARGESKDYYRHRYVQLAEELRMYDKAGAMLDEMIADSDRRTRGHKTLRAARLRMHVLAAEDAEALKYAVEWGEQLTDELTPRQLLAAALGEVKKYEKAQRLLEEWLETADAAGADRLRAMRIDLYCDAEQFDDAVEFAQSWVSAAPGELLPRVTIVTSLIIAARYEQAERLVSTWLAEMSGQTAQATQPADKPLRRQVEQWCREMTVQLLVLMGRYAEAAELAGEHLQLYADSTELMSLRSTALSQLGRRDEARMLLETALELRPQDSLLNNNLAYMYAEAGANLARAEQMIRKALADRPEELSFLDSLGWVFYKTGRMREAGAVFMQVIDQADGERLDPIILDHAGDTYWRLGWRDEAVSLWRRAAEVAGKATSASPEVRATGEAAATKIRAAEAGRRPKVAPLASDGAGE